MLDEADRMLAMGFAPALEALRRALSLGRPQVALFTATLPAEAKRAARAWMQGLHGGEEDDEEAPEEAQGASPPVFIRLGPADAGHVSPSVTQTVHVCAEHKKLGKLKKHLARVEAEAREAGARQLPRVVVFCNRIKTVAFLARELQGKADDRQARPGPPQPAVAALHGDLSQAERDAAVAAFRAGKARVLVATDVAARGLHVRNLPHVVNYDFPTTLEQYIHRCVRAFASRGGSCRAPSSPPFFASDLGPHAVDALVPPGTHRPPATPERAGRGLGSNPGRPARIADGAGGAGRPARAPGTRARFAPRSLS